MIKLFKVFGILVAIVFGIYSILPALFILVFMPVIAITDGFKIISTGFSVTGFYIGVLMAALLIIYISLKIRSIRRIYNAFPFLFETVKFLTSTNLFLATGAEVLNWCYTSIDQTRHIIGITVFVASMVLWRIFISVYYYKKPLVDFMPRMEDDMKNYNSNA